MPNIRDYAVTLVDGLKGYTIEFAPDKAAHRADYKIAEDVLTQFEAEVREDCAKVAEEMLIVISLPGYNVAEDIANAIRPSKDTG